MLANGRTRPTLFPNNQRTSSEKSTNFSVQFSQKSPSLAAITEGHENGVKSDKRDDQPILDELNQTISTNNNNKSSWPSKMATVNSSGPGQQLTNTNGFPMPLVATNKNATVDLASSQPAINNQASSNIMDNMNSTTSGSMISGGETSNSMPSSSQYNAYNTRQDLLLQGFRSRNASHDINPMMRAAPHTSEQYGSPQQRSYMSGSNDSSIRGLNRQTPSPFPPNYFPQESHNNQAVSRVDSTQSDERNSTEHFQWQQPIQRYPSSLPSNPSPAQPHSHSPMQQSGIPPRQPPPYMMMGQALPPPSQSPQQYMMQSQMKANTMSNPAPPYYGGMGPMIQRQQGLANQMQKQPQEYGSYQQQPFYSQPQFPSSLPPYMQSRQQQQQQSMSQSPSNMSRMMPTQQPILPKPSMDMYARYPNNISSDHRMEFQGPVMNEQMQQQPQHRQQQSYSSPGGVGHETINHRGYYSGYPSSPSPNVTMGSPLRNLPEGFTNNSANLPPMPGTPTFPNTPPSSGMPFSSGTATQSNAAAAAAAAVMQAVNSRYPPSMGHQSSDQSGYSSHDNIGAMRGRIPNTMPSSGLPGIDGPGNGSTIETGRVQSPTLNILPTAEDVEAMIQSMSSEDTCMNDSTTQPQSCPPFVPTSTVKHELVNDSLSSASPAQNVTRTTTNTSPLSSFSEEFPGVTSPGVSISSFCDDDNDDMNVPVDDITPTLGQSANVVMMTKQTNKDTPQFGKYSLLYELTDEPERKEFLDKYSSFMESTGNTVKQVPVFNNQLLDIYKLYKVIKANGGLQEVVKRKLWDKVLMSLNISPDQTVLSNQLRNHYSRFLLAYEMADVTKSTHTAVGNLFDDTGIPPPNATVTCSEVLFPAPTMSMSSQPGSVYPTQYGQQQAATNGPQSYGSYNEGFIEGQYDNKGYNMSHNTSNYNMTQYSAFNERTNNYTNYQGFPAQQSVPQSQFPGSVALSQLLQQRSSNITSYPINQSRPQQDHPMWPQYKASTEPEQMFDYPPKQHYPSNRQPYPPTPPQYRHSPPPHGARSPSLPRQPVAPTHQAQSQIAKSKFQNNHVKKDFYFPLESVEATKPVFTKKRKLTSRDLGPVEAWRVMMSLKSGLLSETTWALDALNILLYDDHTVGYFLLSHLPGLLDNLLDHFRRYLAEIFGPFWEGDSEEEEQLKSEVLVQREKTEEDDKLQQDVCRSLTAFIAASSIDFESNNVDEWWLNSSQTTKHIQTHLGTDVSPKGEQDDGAESAETNVKLKLYDSAVMEETEVKAIETENTKVCDGGHCEKPTENCMIPKKEWDLDSDDSISDADNSPVKAEQKNDSRLPSEEEFTSRLRKELDLDIEPSDDSDTNAYIQSVIETRIKRSKSVTLVEEQSFRTEESTLSLRTESDDALSRRVMCISNIVRGLSFVPGNDVEMFRHSGLLLILGKLLLLYHRHAIRVPYRHSFMQDDLEVDAPSDDRHDWWWSALEVLRENALVIFSNIAGQLDLCAYRKSISGPILDGLLHWFVCQSAEAIDPMPTATVGTSLSARQLVLETLAKMSILGGNTELILSSSSSRLEALYATLIRLLGQRENPVSRELSLVVLSNLSQSDSEYSCLTDKKQCIAMLLQFIEDAANSINAYSSGGSLAQAGFHSEDFCGTSVDMLRRAASTLVCLARSKPIRSLFLPYQERLLLLTTLKLLERMIGPQLADVLYYLSR